ncbi:MAG: hypothetical protein KIT31_26170 [Deltaproteobacteria bacterium]|nr:hypothetical protein [Deltaproteobacteria bacterium]
MIRSPLLLLAALGCASDVSLGGPNTLVRVDAEGPGANCAAGGVAIRTGQDLDDDSYLDDDEVMSTQYVCNGEPQVQCAGGTILAGTIVIREPSDFDQLAGVNCVQGQLLVVGLASDELPALDALEVVTGDVIIANTNVASLAGLSKLRQVGGRVLVQANDALATLDGIGNLDRVSSIAVLGNDRLADLRGLESFLDIHASLKIANNANLTSLAGLDNLVSCGGTISIVGNRRLADLAALRNLRSITLLEITSNAGLATVALPSLERVAGRLLVNTNAALASLDVPALGTVGDFLQLNGNAALASVRLPKLLTIAGLLVTNDTSLERVAVPSLLFATTSVELVNLPRVTSVDLGSLLSIGGNLTVGNVAALPNLAGLGQLGSIGGNLTINNAGALANLTGLGALETVAGDMSVTNNPRLTSLGGAAAMTEVGQNLTITNNPMLPRPTAQAFANGITVRGMTTIN